MEDIWEWQNDEWRVMRMISSIGNKKLLIETTAVEGRYPKIDLEKCWVTLLIRSELLRTEDWLNYAMFVHSNDCPAKYTT